MSDYPYRVRPIDQWPGELTRERRRSPFSAAFGSTMQALHRELWHLEAKEIVLQIAIEESDIRLDGQPRARAVARHPGVILAFDSVYGPLKYATDVFERWQDNLRAIALGLEALRKVDRYGITKRGEQYTGWKALPAADGPTSRDEAIRALAEVARWPYDPDWVPDEIRDLERAALRRAHPDTGGDDETFRRVQAARRVLEGSHA